MTKLILPDIGNYITIKIIGDIENTGYKLYYCNCKIWGLRNTIILKDGTEKENKFRLQITKSIWISLYQELKAREELMPEGEATIDPELNCIVGRIITIKGVEAKDISFDDGSYGKIFQVQLREDLEDYERIGGKDFGTTIDREVERCNKYININLFPIKKVKNVDTHGIIKLDSWS